MTMSKQEVILGLLRDLTDLKLEIAKLRMENNRLKAEVDKCRRAE